MSQTLPTNADIVSAAGRLKGHAVRTPLLCNDILDGLTGAQVFIKPECLQKTGSFKFRGAYNAISSLSEAERKAGVVACSSGNHAQGVAEAARLLGVSATIVMPLDAPAIKKARTERSGATVVGYDRASEDRDAIAAEICGRTGAAFIHPYNDARVIAGQGTCGMEIAEDLSAAGIACDRVLVCTGGGGLTAGVALAIHERFPGARIHAVEPQGFDDYRRSLEAGELLSNENLSGSACDALLSPSPGAIGFAINRDHLESALVVSDEEAFEAMRFAFNELKLVLEPGGAVTLAALLSAGKRFAGESIAIVLSGGNVDPGTFARIVSPES
ncbi:MAG: threonine/serine dehydratase [Nitratireductor sp.]|nr:threonine/serine dehydratase [Nitratireductor sp.]